MFRDELLLLPPRVGNNAWEPWAARGFALQFLHLECTYCIIIRGTLLVRVDLHQRAVDSFNWPE